MNRCWHMHFIVIVDCNSKSQTNLKYIILNKILLCIHFYQPAVVAERFSACVKFLGSNPAQDYDIDRSEVGILY